MKIIYLEWEDAHSSNGWHTKEDVDKFKDEAPVIRQVGWVYEETKHYLILYSRFAPNGIFTDDEDVAYAHLQRIPKPWIKKQIDLTKHIK